MTKQSRARSLKRAEDGSSPNKKMEVIGSLNKKYKMRIALCRKQCRKYEDLSDEEVKWLKNGETGDDVHKPWQKRQCLCGKGWW